MEMKRLLLLLSASLLLASCGGGNTSEQSSSSPDPVSSEETGSSAIESSSTVSIDYDTDPEYGKAPGSYAFPSYASFPKADKDALPELTGDKIVAFCPVSSGYTHAYAWVADEGNRQLLGGWPGTQMTTKHNDKWFKVELNVNHTGLIFSKNGSPQTKDMVITEPGYYWFHESDQDIHDDVPTSSFIASAKMTDANTIRIVANKNIEEFTLYEDDNAVITGRPGNYNAVDIKLNKHRLDIFKSYKATAKVNGEDVEKSVNIKYFYKTDEFNTKWAYTGDDLGVSYTVSKSVFKVWSPISTSIDLKIYENGAPSSIGGSDIVYKTVEMIKGEHGVWSAEVNEDLNGKYYTYLVKNPTYPTGKEIVDPYARSAGLSGKRGMILDLSATNPEGWDQVSPHNIDRKALVVYESHIADLTSSSTWTGLESGRKKYAGFYQDNTTYTRGNKTVKTGFAHIKELGVNAVQLIPIFDQDNDERVEKFNWGYNPLNYNVPEGLYSSNPRDGAIRVRELKELVKAYHDAGINIIMDVVYNHVSSAIGSNFDVLYPGYYYRYTDNDSISNGSGCGNETASDHYMFRKFMIDSTEYWAREYKLGGFRFDLMAIHDIETMNQLTANCQKVFPGIVIYGEPWAGGDIALDGAESAKQANGNKFVGYGQFNDGMRDALIKGGLHGETELGWATTIDDTAMNNDVEAIKAGIKGFTKNGVNINDPDKTVNYVTCHDNYTIHDRVALNYEDYPELTSSMAMLAEAVVMTSQGTSFMLSGDEMLRSKVKENGEYDHNSYESSYATNAIDYNLKIDNADYYEAFKSLVAFKINVDGMHLDKNGAAALAVNAKGYHGNLLTYDIKDAAHNRTYRIAHQAPFELDDEDYESIVNAGTVDFSGYSLYLDTTGGEPTLNGSTQLLAGQTIIAYK